MQLAVAASPRHNRFHQPVSQAAASEDSLVVISTSKHQLLLLQVYIEWNRAKSVCCFLHKVTPEATQCNYSNQLLIQSGSSGANSG